jgi:hypothetical protein
MCRHVCKKKKEGRKEGRIKRIEGVFPNLGKNYE